MLDGSHVNIQFLYTISNDYHHTVKYTHNSRAALWYTLRFTPFRIKSSEILQNSFTTEIRESKIKVPHIYQSIVLPFTSTCVRNFKCSLCSSDSTSNIFLSISNKRAALFTSNYCAPLAMERKRTSSQRSAIVTDTKVEQQSTPSKTLKLSLSNVSKLKSNTFLFDAHPNENQATVLSTLIRVTEDDISVYCSDSVKALNHINVLWKSFITSEPVCMVLLRIFRQLVVKCTVLEECVKDMLLHFISNSKSHHLTIWSYSTCIPHSWFF